MLTTSLLGEVRPMWPKANCSHDPLRCQSHVKEGRKRPHLPPWTWSHPSQLKLLPNPIQHNTKCPNTKSLMTERVTLREHVVPSTPWVLMRMIWSMPKCFHSPTDQKDANYCHYHRRKKKQPLWAICDFLMVIWRETQGERDTVPGRWNSCIKNLTFPKHLTYGMMAFDVERDIEADVPIQPDGNQI